MANSLLGIDEVGRGALAGPVVVGVAVVSAENAKEVYENVIRVLKRPLTDSKHLTRLQRERAATYLMQTVPWAVGEASAQEIDAQGIVRAVWLAAGRALDQLDLALIGAIDADAGLFHPYEKTIITTRHIRGDETLPHISYASIIAKVYRDDLMRALHTAHPDYGWQNNVGYGTKQHLQALRERGLTPEHRYTFVHTG